VALAGEVPWGRTLEVEIDEMHAEQPRALGWLAG
jgi:hypothetical protein